MDPVDAAGTIVRAGSQRACIVLSALPPASSWDRAVTVALGALQGAGTPQGTGQNAAVSAVLFASPSDVLEDLPVDVYEVGATLESGERARWWEALAQAAAADITDDSLPLLEDWWRGARHASPPADDWARATPELRRLATRLALAGRSWAIADVALLGAEGGAVAGLEQGGLATASAGWLAVNPAWVPRAVAAADAEDAAVMARALEERLADDPWAQARAAGLWARTSNWSAAEDAFAKARSLADDPLARREIVAGWGEVVAALPPEAQRPLLFGACERALVLGEADEAFRWAQAATAIAPLDREVTLLFARAAAAQGDIVAARVAFGRAASGATDDGERAVIASEVAELQYLSGDMVAAEQEARRALAFEAASPRTRLKARNLIGKVLLARSAWEEADAHFAEDVWLAAAAGLHTEELRARLNRGIALLSNGQVDESRAVFELVLAEGERAGDARASAFALDNLSVVATIRHDYANALALAERTLKLRRRIGDRVATARVLANLAELRRRLGLIDHAEHAVAFGRRSLGPGMPPARSCLFSLNAARNALARRSTVEARREATRALTESETAGVQGYAADALTVLARVALDDGDLARAAELLGRARSMASTDSLRAETAILAARHARALGHPEGEALCAEALVAAGASGEEDLVIEAHMLLAEVHRIEGRTGVARAHVEQAVALRDQVASTLPSEVRTAFLARADLLALSALRAALRDPEPEAAAPASSVPRAGRPQQPAREIVGEHPAVRTLVAAIKKVARASGTVLVRGESGTGKELVAEAIHRASDRASGPLVTVNGAALVETLLLSELFGHEKGAFTGAVARRRGRFELAEGGTLFLDEIGDISPRTQVALLRVLEERTYERVGGTSPIRADVRVVCATHRDLKAMVERGEFREDLYYRLCGITLEVPPLRARLSDVARIGEHLLARIAAERAEEPKTLTPDAVELLARYRWPGNVRELENALRAASLFAEGSAISAAVLADNVYELRMNWTPRGRPTLPLTPDDAPSPPASSEEAVELPFLPTDEARATSVAYAQVRAGGTSLPDIKRQIERDCIARALTETRGNITRAASLLGMKRPRLSQLVKQYGLTWDGGEVPE